MVHAAAPVLLWGVDSCSPYVDHPLRGPGPLPVVTLALGRPDFWGRYLTDSVCPALSSLEIQAAHARRMGILPIFNEALFGSAGQGPLHRVRLGRASARD